MERSTERHGATVFSADGEKLGKVVGDDEQFLRVEKGFLFPTDYSVPTSAIAREDDDGIHLSVTKASALASGWDRADATGDTWTQGNYSTAVAGYRAELSGPLAGGGSDPDGDTRPV